MWLNVDECMVKKVLNVVECLRLKAKHTKINE